MHTPPQLQRGYVLSDLHIFAPWSTAESHMTRWRDDLAGAEFLVLNGDIFDFSWTHHASVEECAKAATEWLRLLIEDLPQCRFHYVLGNHDSHVALVKELEHFASAHATFEWYPSYVSIGSSFFMHGDLAWTRREEATLVRTEFGTGVTKHPTLRTLYDRVIRLGAHRCLRHVYRPERCVRTLLRALTQADGIDVAGIEDVYTGHTHAAFSDVEYQSIRWHNTGSAVHDAPCHLLPVSVRSCESPSPADTSA